MKFQAPSPLLQNRNDKTDPQERWNHSVIGTLRNTDPQQVELLRMVDNLLAAVESLNGCLEDHEAAIVDGRLAAARAVLRTSSNEARAVIERQRAGSEVRESTKRIKPSQAEMLQTAIEALEWQAAKQSAIGDVEGAIQSAENARLLRQEAGERSVIDRRNAMKLVSTD